MSKVQLKYFREQCRLSIRKGQSRGQPDPNKPFYYPQERFDDRSNSKQQAAAATWSHRPRRNPAHDRHMYKSDAVKRLHPHAYNLAYCFV